MWTVKNERNKKVYHILWWLLAWRSSSLRPPSLKILEVSELVIHRGWLRKIKIMPGAPHHLIKAIMLRTNRMAYTNNNSDGETAYRDTPEPSIVIPCYHISVNHSDLPRRIWCRRQWNMTSGTFYAPVDSYEYQVNRQQSHVDSKKCREIGSKRQNLSKVFNSFKATSNGYRNVPYINAKP